jgi:hypothetical protein
VRIHALLNWYDEPAARLAATIASLKGLCDSVIAVDGAYALFPGGLRRPASGQEQVDTIVSVARALGMGVTIHQRPEVWFGNEVEKRGFMFALAETLSTPEDWYFLIDADEVVSQLPYDTRALIEKATEFDAAEAFMWETAQNRTLPDGTEVGYLGAHPIRRFWRALRGIEVGPAHHQFHVGDKWLSDAGRPYLLVPALTLHDVRIEHRNVFRADNRLALKGQYYAARDHLGIERNEDD